MIDLLTLSLHTIKESILTTLKSTYLVLLFVSLSSFMSTAQAQVRSLTASDQEQKLETTQTPSDIPKLTSAQSKEDQPKTSRKGKRITSQTPVSIGRLSDTLYAIFPGIITHGVGHWSQGDFKTARAIFTLELLGISTLLGGLALSTYGPKTSQILPLSGVWLTHIGSMMLVTSWMTDLIGSYRGKLLDRLIHDETKPNDFSIGYRYHNNPQDLLNHQLIAGVDLTFKRWELSSSLTLEANGDLLGFEGELLGWLVGETSPTHSKFGLAFGVKARRWSWLQEQFTQLLVTPLLEAKLALDTLSKGLRGYTVFHRLGVGRERFEFAPHATSTRDIALIRYPLLLESGLRVNPRRDLYLQLSILQDNTLDQRPFTESQLFMNTVFQYRQTETVSLNARALIGHDWSVWLIMSFRILGSQ